MPSRDLIQRRCTPRSPLLESIMVGAFLKREKYLVLAVVFSALQASTALFVNWRPIPFAGGLPVGNRTAAVVGIAAALAHIAAMLMWFSRQILGNENIAHASRFQRNPNATTMTNDLAFLKREKLLVAALGFLMLKCALVPFVNHHCVMGEVNELIAYNFAWAGLSSLAMWALKWVINLPCALFAGNK